ncbi:MAG: hypothetical protein QXP84_07630 [Candidatus Korarchaeum sp.]
MPSTRSLSIQLNAWLEAIEKNTPFSNDAKILRKYLIEQGFIPENRLQDLIWKLGSGEFKVYLPSGWILERYKAHGLVRP